MFCGGLTYGHTPTDREPAPKEEEGKDGDHVGSDLEQSAGNQVWESNPAMFKIQQYCTSSVQNSAIMHKFS